MGRGVTPPLQGPAQACPAPPCPASCPPRGALWDLGAGCEVEDAALEDGVAAGETLAPYRAPGDSAPSGSPLRSGPGALTADPAPQGFTPALDAGVSVPHARAGDPTQAAP